MTSSLTDLGPLFNYATAPHNGVDTSKDAAGQFGKEDGMYRVESNANSEWKDAALKVVLHYAKHKPHITVNDLWEGMDTLGLTTHNNKASGPVFLKAARNNWIEKTNQTDTSSRPTRHKGEVRIWRSLLYRQEVA